MPIAQRRGVGVVVEHDELRAPHEQHPEPRVQGGAHRGPQRGRPGLLGAERGAPPSRASSTIRWSSVRGTPGISSASSPSSCTPPPERCRHRTCAPRRSVAQSCHPRGAPSCWALPNVTDRSFLLLSANQRSDEFQRARPAEPGSATRPARSRPRRRSRRPEWKTMSSSGRRPGSVEARRPSANSTPNRKPPPRAGPCSQKISLRLRPIVSWADGRARTTSSNEIPIV